MVVLQLLYDADILDEEDVSKWWLTTKSTTDPDEAFVNLKATPFIEWMNEEDDDESGSDDDE